MPLESYGAWSIDPTRLVAVRGGVSVAISGTEAKLLAYLAERRDRVISREELLTQVWGYHPSVQSRTVDVTVRRIRAKLEDDPDQPAVLMTMFGEGYRLLSQSGPAPTAVVSQPLTSFVGRDAELMQVERALSQGARLLTITGAPGIGKSRLAEVALAAHSNVLATDLFEVSEESSFLHALAESAGCGDRTKAPDRSRMVEVLRGRPPTLWWIDHPEAGGPALSSTLLALIAEVPNLVVICSSQVPLGVAGETRISLGPLEARPAVELLCQRAAALDVECSPDDPDLVALADRLDYHPLALELAATRLDALAPRELLTRIERSYHVLTTSRIGVAERHQGLERAVRYTWEHLSEAERQIGSYCALFESPFPIDAVDAVAGVAWENDALDALERLRIRGLLSFDRASRRYRLWRVVRPIARAYGSSEESAAAWGRYAAYWLDAGEAACVRYDQRGDPADSAVLQSMVPELRAVATEGSLEESVRARLCFVPLLQARVAVADLAAIPVDVRDLPEPLALNADAGRARALHVLDRVAEAAAGLDERARRAFAGSGPSSGRILVWEARRALEVGRSVMEVLPWLREGVARTKEWPYVCGTSMWHLAYQEVLSGEFDAALATANDLIALAGTHSLQQLEQWGHNIRSTLYYFREDGEKSLSDALAARRLAAHLDAHTRFTAALKCAFAQSLCGRTDEAIAAARDAEQLLVDLPGHRSPAALCEALGYIALENGDPRVAMEHLNRQRFHAERAGRTLSAYEAVRGLVLAAFLLQDWTGVLQRAAAVVPYYESEGRNYDEAPLLVSEVALAHAALGQRSMAVELMKSAFELPGLRGAGRAVAHARFAALLHWWGMESNAEAEKSRSLAALGGPWTVALVEEWLSGTQLRERGPVGWLVAARWHRWMADHPDAP